MTDTRTYKIYPFRRFGLGCASKCRAPLSPQVYCCGPKRKGNDATGGFYKPFYFKLKSESGQPLSPIGGYWAVSVTRPPFLFFKKETR